VGSGLFVCVTCDRHIKGTVCSGFKIYGLAEKREILRSYNLNMMSPTDLEPFEYGHGTENEHASSV